MPAKWTLWTGVVDTVRHIPHIKDKISFALYFSTLLAHTVWYYITCIPFFVRLTSFYWLFPPRNVYKNISYKSSHEKQRLDVYASRVKNSPIVLFVHGGAWGSGDTWQYCLVGRFFVDRDVTCVVMTYRAFPDGWVGEQIADVDAGLDWIIEHCSEYNGDAKKIVLMGHSAGAHLACMVMAHRLRTNKLLPALVIGSVGVYDIARHYEYEWWRGVSELSTMKQAFQGTSNFGEYSPEFVFTDLYKELNASDTSRSCHEEQAQLFKRTLQRLRSVTFEGDKIADRVGIVSSAGGPRDKWQTRENSSKGSEMWLPPIILLTSGMDATVPWHTTVSFHNALVSSGFHSRILLYDGVGHGDFATDYMVNTDRDFRGPRYVPAHMSGIDWRERVETYDHEPQIPAHVRDVMAITQLL